MMYNVKRTQIQLDEVTYAALRRRAFEEHRSLASVVRDVLATALGVGPRPVPRRAADFRFVGAGRSRQGALAPVSTRHDEALARSLKR
jgi:plasmid stability protein